MSIMISKGVQVNDVLEYNDQQKIEATIKKYPPRKYVCVVEKVLVVKIVPYSILVRGVWGYHCWMSKRSLSKWRKLGTKPERIPKWQWRGECRQKC